ncbi:MAG: transposase [Candidatus Neptunochlamydia sp.]|nr:transposase [Candidatus Neptunochlamydia sp.]
MGCKGKNKYWYSYKQYTSVDMQTDLINKIAIASENQEDATGLKHICPTQRAVYGDKGYCTLPAQKTTQERVVSLSSH